MNPDNVDAHRMSASAYEKLEKFDEAAVALEETIRLAPADTEAHYMIGRFYEEKKDDIDRAMKEYEVVIGLDQTKADPFLRLGAIYVKKGMEDEKIMDVYEKGLTLDPNHPQLQYDLAVLYKKHNNYDKATERYAKANTLSPDNFQWHYEYAKFVDGRNNPRALKEYSRTIELKRDFAQAYYDRAMLLRRAKVIDGKIYRNEQILEDFRQAAELDPSLVQAFFNIGLLYIDMELDELARMNFEKTLKLDPAYIGAQLQLGLIAERREEYIGAM